MILDKIWIDHFFVISDKFFGQNDDLYIYLSTCLFHRFEVWDLQSKLKSHFLKWKKYLSSNERSDFEHSMFWGPKLIKMSQFFDLLTSSSLTPYYSYRAQEICPTSHLKWKGRMSLMKFACALLPELVFEKTCIYYANFWNLYFSIDLPIRIHLKSCI